MTLTSAAIDAHAAESAPTRTTLRSVIAQHRGGLIASAIFAIIAGICALAPYVAIYAVTVALFTADGGGADAVVWIAAATAAAVVVRAVASAVSSHVGHVAAYGILADLRRALARALQRLPLGRVQARSSGEMKKLLHDDVEQLEEALAHGVPDLAAAAAVPITTTVLLFIVDWRLALVALGSLVLLIAIAGTGFALAAPNNALLAQHTLVLNRALLGFLQGIKVIRGFLRPDSGFNQARDAVIESDALSTRVTAGPLRWLVAVMSAGLGLAVAVLIPFAGNWFVDGTIGLPELALFLLVGLAYLTPIIAVVGTLATVVSRIQFASGAVNEVLAESPLPVAATPIVPERFDVTFDAVTFGYDEQTPVLSDVSLRIPEGARFALVGPTGAGKSSVARLLARFWDPSSGSISIGGVDLRDIAPDVLARTVAFVQQDEYLFADTLRENIRVARPGASDAQIAAAASAAQLDDVIATLPDGWDTVVPAGGGTLSGGQRQRVSIARALLKDAPVIVLDEVTASLDAETERATLAAVDALTSGRTVIAIAHRLHTIEDADEIVFIDGGTIAARGDHASLSATHEGYRTLWHAYRAAEGWRLPAGTAARPIVPSEVESAGADDARIAGARGIIAPGLADQSFGRQWLTLLGHGLRPLVRSALPKMILEGLVRSAPLLAVFIVLGAAVANATGGAPVTHTLVWIVSAGLAVALLIRVLAAQWANKTVWTIASRSKADLQLSIVERLRRVPLGFFSRVDNGRITTLVGNDIPMLDFQNVPQQVVSSMVQPLVGAVILSIIDWRLALAALVGLPLFWLLTAWSDRIYHRVFADVHAARRDATMILIEQARGAAVLRGNPGSAIATRFDDAVERLRAASVNMSVKASPAAGLGAIAVESGLAVLIAVGGALYGAGAVAPTTLLLFLMLTLAIYQPVQELAALSGYRHNQQQIAAKIAEVWDAPVLADPDVPAVPADASVEFRGVTFSYADEDEDRRTVLRDVSFRAAPGTITALVGPSGSGKSTIANLTARLWDPDEGAVLIGGKDLRELGSDQVMRLVTTVYQEVYLFGDTVRYNVTLGRPDASDDDVWDALAAARVDDEVRALPGGLDTVLQDGGTDLSGGQRQRLSIARALLKDAPILILDEAVASVDPDTEAHIQDAISRLAAGRTVIVVAHRRETVRAVDQVLTVRHGTIVASAEPVG